MKLRNKKTGEIWDMPKMRYPTIQADDISFFAMQGTNGILFSYKSLAELNEIWEDVEPTEPLIKDEEIRKAIQAWAEANEDDSTTMLKYDEKNVRLSTRTSQIEFDRFPPFNRLEDGATYTIAELCGEEEE